MWILSPSVSLCLFFPLLWHTVDLQALKINTPNLCVCVCVCAELCLLSSQAYVQQRCPGHCHSSGVFDKLLTCIKGKNSLLPSSVSPMFFTAGVAKPHPQIQPATLPGSLWLPCRVAGEVVVSPVNAHTEASARPHFLSDSRGATGGRTMYFKCTLCQRFLS